MRAPVRARAGLTVAVLLLSACGEAENGHGARAKAGWNPTDACAVLPAAKAGEVVGVTVTSTDLNGVHPFGDGGAAVSHCTYATDRGQFGILLREADKGDDNTRGIAEIRSGAGITDPAEELSGLPGIALWQGKLGVLSYFPDKRRMIVVHPLGASIIGKRDPDDVLKARALALAKAIERL